MSGASRWLDAPTGESATAATAATAHDTNSFRTANLLRLHYGGGSDMDWRACVPRSRFQVPGSCSEFGARFDCSRFGSTFEVRTFDVLTFKVRLFECHPNPEPRTPNPER